MRVALTFDAEHPDRPAAPDGTEAVVAALAALEVRATFFVQGRWVEAFPAVARTIVDGGHLVGNHSFYHARMRLLSPSGFDRDVRAADAAIRQRLGIDARPWFRLPFGDGHDDPAIDARLTALGYRNAHWHVEAKEWRTRASVRSVERAIVDGVTQHGDGAIVMLHPWPTPTARALPAIVARLRADGARFVTLDQLAAVPA